MFKICKIASTPHPSPLYKLPVMVLTYFRRFPIFSLGWLVLFLIQSAPAAAREQITILDPAYHQQVITYGVHELSTILSTNYTVRISSTPDRNGWNIVLKVDSAMSPFSFSVQQPTGEVYKSIYLSGHDPTCVLHAIYTMLQVIGYNFDLTGIRKPANPSLQRLTGYSRVIRPAVERRGIRQHINFLMDISSYPVEEAKEYIRNLARLRMNYITFHSYPGQWYAFTYHDTPQLAGHFFYGEQDSVPKDKSISKLIRNKSIYCIPEIEPFWDDQQKRSRLAIAWLDTVMAEAKTVGMKVRFSYELRTPGIEYAKTTSTAILQEYPLIDEMEFITQEDVPGYLGEIRNDVICADALRDTLRKRNIQLSTGIYNTTEDELKKGFELLRASAPSDMQLTVLPAHGARMVDKNLQAIPLTPNDIARTMIYSWIQLDGMMYLQQNPVEGIRSLIDNSLKTTDNKPLYGICWNHWQNYENRTAAIYAAAAMIDGPLPVRRFYDSLASRSAISDTAGYASAMSKLDATDDYCRQNIVTIGFCPKVYWSGPSAGLGHYIRYSKQKLLSAISQYSETSDKLLSCLKATGNNDSRRDLRFLVNRIQCSILYLKAFVAMTDLRPIFKNNPKKVLSHQDSTLVVRRSQIALAYEKQYLNTFSAYALDRGCEGTLVSFYSVPVQALKDIISSYQNRYRPIPSSRASFDAPPPPK